MRELPLISIIVPVYGAEEYMDQCVASVVNQTYSNLEIILLDDASPGNSGKICDEWALRDNRIKVIHKENSGTGATRNMGMEMASGSLIAFLDCDDYLHPQMYEHLYSIMDDETDIAECGYVKVYDDDDHFPDAEPEVKTYTPQEAMRLHIREEAFCQLVWNKLYRKEAVGDVRFIPGAKMDDEYFTYRVLARARKLVSSSKVCHAYRQREGSIVHQAFSLARVEFLYARMERLKYVKAHMPELETEEKVSLMNSCIAMMQNVIWHFSGEERQKAERIIGEAMEAAKPIEKDDGISWKQYAMLWLAQRNLKAVCKMLNVLTDLHILS